MADIETWRNPLRNSLQGEDAYTLNQILDDLEKFLKELTDALNALTP